MEKPCCNMLPFNFLSVLREGRFYLQRYSIIVSTFSLCYRRKINVCEAQNSQLNSCKENKSKELLLFFIYLQEIVECIHLIPGVCKL